MPTGQPTYLTVDSQGRIGANFTGHVHAQGLDLDAGINATPPDVNRIRWIRQSDGAVVANISSNSQGGNDALNLVAGSSLDAQASIGLIAQPNVPFARNGLAELFLNAQVNGPSSLVAVATDGALSHNATLLDSSGNSNFIQLGHSGQSITGTTAVTWPGGVAGLAAPAIPLPFTPAGAIASAVNTNSVGQVLITPQGVTNGLTLFLTEIPSGAVVPGGTITYVSWLAWS